MRYNPLVAGLSLTAAAMVLGQTAAGSAPADTAYRNGFVYTVDAQDSVQQALAIRAGRIVYVGTDAGLGPYLGEHTAVIDLHGRMLMPGLVDGHMHPMDGGRDLLKCDLNYQQLRIEEMQAKIQSCLDDTRVREPDGWLEVVHWFQEGMLPAGTTATRATLDGLHTKRPIFVMSSFYHTGLANSRALALAGITAATRDPLGGKIGRDAAGNPSGILDEDAAYNLVKDRIPAPTAAEDVKAARTALDAIRQQGVTTFLDAQAKPPFLAAFAAVEREGQLTARAHFAVWIAPDEGRNPQKAMARVMALARRYDQGPIEPRPRLTVRNVKLFLDGVISAPAFSGAMLEPYFVSQGREPNQRWVAGTNRGPEVYFPAAVLRTMLIEAAAAGFEPHMHVDGDRAVHEALDGVQALREHFPDKDIRAALAHDEIVDPRDFARYKQLNAIPVLSLQWAKPAADTIDGARDYLGPERFKYIEPSGFLAAAGARIAFGSDWPVDALDEWFALKVGVTRTNSPQSDAKFAGRLGEDPGLSRAQVLRAATMNSSYELHQDQATGSLEPGKLADLIVLDRNVLKIPAEEIAQVRVLQTVVGGRVVYQREGF
ncbi:MAG: amidohydrolase [Steroidobacteraceae bacterium]